jgi:hypothetical protein
MGFSSAPQSGLAAGRLQQLHEMRGWAMFAMRAGARMADDDRRGAF